MPSTYFNQIDEKRRTAIYVRISTAMQKTDRQVEELVAFAKSNRLNFDESTDIYKDIISGFKDGEDRPNFSILMAKLEMGEYTQVLFSEFSRLERKPTNLLRDLEKFQSLGVYAWFSKQNLWVRDDKDLGTQIMIHILAVMSQYEIELLAARGIDGKISSMKNRGAYNGGPCPYGYTISPGTGKLAINPEEAEVVRTIFEKFSKGEKTAAITDWLNTSGIPCSFRTRIAEASQRRINKGIAPVKYKRCNVENMIWRTTTVNRIVKNKVYIGVQHHKFHEPDSSNPLPSRKRKNRVLLTEFDVQTPHTRIIDDELFLRVNKIFEERAFNRNQSIRHGNLLKTLLRCGECGNRFCAVTLPMGRSYKCAGRTGVCKVKCSAGAGVLMSKLDGLVLKLCIDKFAKYDLQQKAKGDYSYSADVCYTVTSSAGKTTGRKLSISGKANSASPDATKFTVDANINGYTSYSCYKGTDGQIANVNTANGKDNATIYNVSATHKNGLTPDVYNQCSNLITIKTYIDNVEASSDVGEQPLGSHTISASVSFDGSSHTTCPTTRTVYITGLPYNRSNSSTTKFKGDWSFSGGTSEWDDDNSRYKLRDGATATFKGFYIPADVNGTVDYRIEAYVWMIGYDLTTIFNVGSTSVINETISGRNKTVEYKATESVSFTSAQNTITCQSEGSSSSWSTSQVLVYHIGVTYR